MTKKDFEKRCKELEDAGWTIMDYEPELKKATYFKEGRYEYVK